LIGSFKEFIVLKSLGKSEINADKILNINVQVGGALFSRVTSRHVFIHYGVGHHKVDGHPFLHPVVFVLKL